MVILEKHICLASDISGGQSTALYLGLTFSTDLNQLLGQLLEFFLILSYQTITLAKIQLVRLNIANISGFLLLEFLDTIRRRNFKAIGSWPDISASDRFPPPWLGFLFRVFINIYIKIVVMNSHCWYIDRMNLGVVLLSLITIIVLLLKCLHYIERFSLILSFLAFLFFKRVRAFLSTKILKKSQCNMNLHNFLLVNIFSIYFTVSKN